MWLIRLTFPKLLMCLSLLTGVDFAYGSSSSANVCSRSIAIRIMLERVLQKPCDQITDLDLLSVQELSIRGDMAPSTHSNFAGLTNLRTLTLDDVWGFNVSDFKSVSSLRKLVLRQIHLSPNTWQSSAFANLVNLEELRFEKCARKSLLLSDRSFVGLSALKTLWVECEIRNQPLDSRYSEKVAFPFDVSEAFNFF